MTPSQFVSALQAMSLPSVFNPWRDRCPVHDVADAAARRRQNLESFLEAAIHAEVRTMWIARDLGYRPRVTLEDGIRTYLDWLKHQEGAAK